MRKSILHYFVDTNLFLQCRPLDQLDWTPRKNFDEVRLIVTRPVLREIDYRKNKGNDRAGRRARSMSAMFRTLLDSGEKIVRSSDPRVVLSIEPHHNYSKILETELNYGERDDELIGTILEFVQRNPAAEVRLLTHDTIPHFIARDLNLQTDSIPDDWLLPPETTKMEKKLKSLEAEVARLQKSEPSLSIRFLDQKRGDVNVYQASHTWFDCLTDAQIDELISRLKDRFPLETDFGSRQPEEHTEPPAIGNLFMSRTRRYVPATDEAIAHYREKAYPGWLESCEHVLRQHHRSLQKKCPALGFSFVAVNRGTRPATDALITVEAQGHFKIRPPPADEEDVGHAAEVAESRELQGEVLPEPPAAPCGYWEDTLDTGLRRISDFARSVSDFQGLTPGLGGIDSLHAAAQGIGHRDANAFYYKPNRPSIAQEAFAVECEQWRHDDGEEHFAGEIHILKRRDCAQGVLTCRVQASNLTTSESLKIPVRIEIACISAFQSAREMVEALAGRG